MTRTYMVVLLLTGAALAACTGCAQQTIDPKADAALRAMGETLGAAKLVSFRAVGVTDEEAATGQFVQISRESRILIRRPDGFCVESEGGDVYRTVWYDGKSLTVLDRDTNRCATIKAKSTIDKTHDAIVDEYGLSMPLADFVCGNSYEAMKANVQTGAYVGLADVDGHSCHHLAFTQEAIDWQIWIDAGKVAVPRKIVIVYKQEEGHPGFTATMDQWDLAARITDGMLKPVLPAKAQQVEMVDLLGLEEGE